MKKKITVVGSSNLDIVVNTPNFPQPGETIMGNNYNTFHGGKGANQAVAVSRLGGAVSFVSKVGNDSFGNQVVNGFGEVGFNSKYVFKDQETASGVAVIMINKAGQNAIVVTPGANNLLSVGDITNATPAIEEADIVLVQLEIPHKTVEFTIDVAYKLQKKIILNPAPPAPLTDNVYSKLFLITPNETEVAYLTGVEVIDEKTANFAADFFLNKGVKNVIITLGSKGAFFKNSEQQFMVNAYKVDVVDTTAAGDIFNGALAVALAENKPWKEALDFANKAASIGVGKLGAQSSIPYRSQIKL